MRGRPAVLSTRSMTGFLLPELGRSQETPTELVRYAVAESDSIRLNRLVSCRLITSESVHISNTNQFTSLFVISWFMTKLSIFFRLTGHVLASGKSQSESGTKTGVRSEKTPQEWSSLALSPGNRRSGGNRAQSREIRYRDSGSVPVDSSFAAPSARFPINRDSTF